jgi:hypothetical protein
LVSVDGERDATLPLKRATRSEADIVKKQIQDLPIGLKPVIFQRSVAAQTHYVIPPIVESLPSC